MTYVKKSVMSKFILTHQLSDAKVPINDICSFVHRKPNTVKFWLKFTDYEAFHKHLEINNHPVKVENIKKEVHTFTDEMIERLDRIEKLVNDRIIY